jgi:mono-ADP-ribosyltransferase sirtuin 6
MFAGASPSSAAAQRGAPKSFNDARPTPTHHALTWLTQKNFVDQIVTQNVDGLHQRAHMPRSNLSILHGCVFETKCERCGQLYFEAEEVSTISFQPTGRVCTAISVGGSPRQACGGIVRDTLLDWEDALPEDELQPSERACREADLVIALGTSLRIEPAGSLPLLCKRKPRDVKKDTTPGEVRGKFVIVNLQEGAKDRHADLIIRARVDRVMQIVMERVGGQKAAVNHTPSTLLL